MPDDHWYERLENQHYEPSAIPKGQFCFLAPRIIDAVLNNASEEEALEVTRKVLTLYQTVEQTVQPQTSYWLC